MRKIKEIKFDRYTFLGLFVLASVIANQTVNYMHYHDFFEVLWFCDATAFILGIGLILKSKAAATLTLVMAIPAQFLWIVDFFLEAAGSGMGRTQELWQFGPWVFWFSVNLHGILIPISLYAVWKLGFERKILKAVLLYAFFLLAATYLTTNPPNNRNCVFFDCDASDPGYGYLVHFTFKLVLLWEIIFVLSFFLQKKFFTHLEAKRKNGFGEDSLLQMKK